MARNSWFVIFIVCFFAVYFVSVAVTGLSITFAGWPLILAVLALLIVLAYAFNK